MKRRPLAYPLAAVVLAGLGVVVLAAPTPENLVVVAALAALVSLVLPWEPPRAKARIRVSPRSALALVVFGGWLLASMVLGFGGVAGRVLGIGARRRSTIVDVPCATWSRTAVALATWALTLTPGSYLAHLDYPPRRMRFHLLDGSSGESFAARARWLYDRVLRHLFVEEHHPAPGREASP